MRVVALAQHGAGVGVARHPEGGPGTAGRHALDRALGDEPVVGALGGDAPALRHRQGALLCERVGVGRRERDRRGEDGDVPGAAGPGVHGPHPAPGAAQDEPVLAVLRMRGVAPEVLDLVIDLPVAEADVAGDLAGLGRARGVGRLGDLAPHPLPALVERHPEQRRVGLQEPDVGMLGVALVEPDARPAADPAEAVRHERVVSALVVPEHGPGAAGLVRQEGGRRLDLGVRGAGDGEDVSHADEPLAEPVVEGSAPLGGPNAELDVVDRHAVPRRHELVGGHDEVELAQEGLAERAAAQEIEAEPGTHGVLPFLGPPDDSIRPSKRPQPIGRGMASSSEDASVRAPVPRAVAPSRASPSGESSAAATAAPRHGGSRRRRTRVVGAADPDETRHTLRCRLRWTRATRMSPGPARNGSPIRAASPASACEARAVPAGKSVVWKMSPGLVRARTVPPCRARPRPPGRRASARTRTP